MGQKVVISHRGARYEIGRGENFYGIWTAGTPEPRSHPLEWWPETRDGWSGAWQRFAAIEQPGTIVPVSQRAAPLPAVGNPVLAAALLAVGVACGIAGLFPGYVGGSSLAQHAAELVPHVIYLAAWTAGAAGILLGGNRLRAGALLGAGTSVVTFGLFFADAGQVIAGGASLMGAGLALALAGWLACTAGSAMALTLRPAGAPAGAPARLAGTDIGPVVVLIVAALGAAVAFAPSWDSYILRTSAGGTQALTAGNVFANPGAMIVGYVATMIALVGVVTAAALWRPVRQGAALLAGAIVPMAAQAISAVVQVAGGASPAQFGISSAQAAQAGLTIDSGVTAAFWIYCAFVVALIASFGWMLLASRRVDPQPDAVPPGSTRSPAPGGGNEPGGVSPGATPGG